MVSAIGEAEKQLVVFSLGAESYGVPIGAVREIIKTQEITHVPGAPDFVEGVVNLRGKVIPVVDLRKRLGIAAIGRNGDNRIVVVDGGGEDIGMIVDTVTEVMRVPAASVEPLAAIVSSADTDYALGIAKLENRLIILLDLGRALSEAEKTSCAELAGAAETSR